MVTAALFAIGNELLNGEIRDLNIYTMSRWLTRLGVTVQQATIARDEAGSIAAQLRFLLNAAPDLLIISGGLGPTADDLTLSALAQALHRPLCPHPGARRLIETHYDRLLQEGLVTRRSPSATREKMALLPQGAVPLYNPVGTAPGVHLLYTGTHIYALPGVPEELEALLESALLLQLRTHFSLGVWVERALYVACDDEAEIARPLQEVVSRYPDVYLKSLARAFPSAGTEGLRVIVAASAPHEVTARETVACALSDLRTTLQTAGFAVRLA